MTRKRITRQQWLAHLSRLRLSVKEVLYSV